MHTTKIFGSVLAIYFNHIFAANAGKLLGLNHLFSHPIVLTFPHPCSDMMNGTLAVKKEISALEKSLVKEEWMSAVPYDKMSDEQKVLLADYEKRVKMLATEVRSSVRETRTLHCPKLCSIAIYS